MAGLRLHHLQLLPAVAQLWCLMVEMRLAVDSTLAPPKYPFQTRCCCLKLIVVVASTCISLRCNLIIYTYITKSMSIHIHIHIHTCIYIYIYLCVVYCVYTHHMYEETFWSALPIASSMTRHLQSLSRGEINWYQPQNPQRVIVWNINIVLYMIYIYI